MDEQLDAIDRRVVYELMADARNTSAPEIATAVDVSPATIRNRISQLEEAGVITGYHAQVDFEAADGRLTNLYFCNAPVAERESFASKVRAIPGVINVRELMTGRRNLHVLAVGEAIDDLRRIARAISSLGIEIEDEDLVQTDSVHPYSPYGPEPDEQRKTLSDFTSLAGGSEIVEVTAGEDAPIVGRQLSGASRRGILDDDTLVIAIEREGMVLTPHGETQIEAGDLVTLFSRGGIADETLASFRQRE
ncbi:DNA-binding Lrp family transcriptional regulator [Halohasta litchfieldiae]|jgi:DNA-binding Lrp family transcriptional regulator|uniref:Transcriptional regulator, AsnC family n=1 Tax=Halohasta litchfieldiae TaxID=1073996 RepID=A0A1H6RPM7_9EURY|nr:Lrp/AsnC family transcriptional regulator [Halohasta litchfieldiae]ATW89232.1 DNA-binding Lrp family transcriptional regulator [Halohasta litchfieldiae]SEI57728.1 transcriptional regulator, AsnC family [Halohasta litchfieldiae]